MNLLDDDSSSAYLREAGGYLAEALDPLAKLFAPQMIILNGTLGANEVYFKGAIEQLSASFNYGPDSEFRLVKGEVAPAEAASLLALHTFCYSDRLDFERLNDLTSGKDTRVEYA